MDALKPDIFYEPPTHGIVYGLFASDEPLQIRYVGKTTRSPESRLWAHCSSYDSRRVRAWVELVATRRAKVGLRVFGEYPLCELVYAERKWISFWLSYCELNNTQQHPERRAECYSRDHRGL